MSETSRALKQIFSALALCIAGSIAPCPAQATEPNTHKASSQKEDQSFVLSYMASRGVDSFLIMDKKSGTLSTVKDGRIVLTIPAVSGKNKTDKISNDHATPAGIWPLTVSYNQLAKDAAILFLDGDNYGMDHSLTIHRAANVRNQFLKSGVSPQLRRRSAVCIALKNANDGYDVISKFVQETPKQELKGSGLSSRFLVVLPEQTPVKEFFFE